MLPALSGLYDQAVAYEFIHSFVHRVLGHPSTALHLLPGHGQIAIVVSVVLLVHVPEQLYGFR